MTAMLLYFTALAIKNVIDFYVSDIHHLA